jgi:hypothetical protein
MDQKQLMQEMIRFNQAAFDKGFNLVVEIQDQVEKMTRLVMDQTPWLPEEGRKAIYDLADAYKAGRNHFKKYVDDGYKSAEEYIAL